MPTNQPRTVDGNEAVASVAYRLNDVIGIYPITPASVSNMRRIFYELTPTLPKMPNCYLRSPIEMEKAF